jgi:hypothetical protein
VNVSPYYEAEEARAAREAARGVNVSPYFEDERRRLEAEQGGPVNVSPYFRQERAREIAEQGVNVSPYFEQEGEQRGAEVRRLRALTAPLEGEQPTRVVEPLVGAKVEQEIAAQRAARGERLIEPNTYAAAEAKADEIMRQEAAATETGRLVQRLAGELGENAAPRKTVREMEDEAFRAWAAKAAGHVITDEEAAVTRRILERAEEAESFKGWDALAKRSRAGDLLLTKKSQQKLPLRERQAPTLGEQLGLFTAPATKQSIEAQRGKRLRESKAPAVLPGQMKLGEAKPVELSAAEHAELDALSADDYMSRVKARVPNLRDQKVQVRAVDSSGAAVGADTVPYNTESALRRMSDKIDTLRKLELCLKT